MIQNKHKWSSGSVPGSLSDKYRAADSYEESIGQNEDDHHKTNKGSLSNVKSELPIYDDGVITTVPEQLEPMHDDRCSSIISLSDKYRTQEEIEIFQVKQGVVFITKISIQL